MSISLASGLYAVHCLLPPHPGASAAAGSLGVDFGKIILYGIPIAIPAMLVGYAWALYAGKKTSISLSEKIADNIEEAPHQRKIPAAVAFLPILVPILLMSLKSVLQFERNDLSMVADIINVIGDPSVALSTLR